MINEKNTNDVFTKDSRLMGEAIYLENGAK